MVEDPFLLYVGVISIFAIIWLAYGLHHAREQMRVERGGLLTIGYASVGFSILFTLVVFGFAFLR